MAFLWSDLSQRDELKEVETAARILRVEFQSLEVKGPDDFEGAFRAAIKGRANGLMLAGGAFFGFHEKRIIDLAAKNRLPAMYIVARFVEAGGLMSYGEDRLEMFRRAAEIVDKILKGTKPAYAEAAAAARGYGKGEIMCRKARSKPSSRPCLLRSKAAASACNWALNRLTWSCSITESQRRREAHRRQIHDLERMPPLEAGLFVVKRQRRQMSDWMPRY